MDIAKFNLQLDIAYCPCIDTGVYILTYAETIAAFPTARARACQRTALNNTQDLVINTMKKTSRKGTEKY